MKFLEKMSDVAGKYFALWVVVVACIAFFIPKPFLIFNGYITLLLGIVMFGMAHVKRGRFQTDCDEPDSCDDWYIGTICGHATCRFYHCLCYEFTGRISGRTCITGFGSRW